MNVPIQDRLKFITLQPLTDLLNYKSFLLLMFFLCCADRLIKLIKGAYHLNLKLPPFWRMDPELSARMLFKFPGLIWKQMGAEHLMLAVAGLFLLNKLLWLWPASDLRRMHRNARGRFAIFGSLRSIGWKAPAWYCLALPVWCAVIAGWCAVCFYICRFGWQRHPSGGWAWVLGIILGVTLPWIWAGFSFASKLAVNAAGSSLEKIGLLFKTVSAWPVAWRAWLFYLAWMGLELLFISLTTTFILSKITPGNLRMLLAIVLATPFYAYLETASFKIFLVVFKDYPAIRQDYEICDRR
ncbi:MAG: hypothetical protein HY911_05840 [Desulfobacterales bacterium]|nr:hypothetical protein [Desulfobacterales bacterium]